MREMADVSVELTPESLGHLKTLAYHMFIERLDECSRSLYLVGNVTGIAELETVIGKCIINSIYVDSLAGYLDERERERERERAQEPAQEQEVDSDK